MSFRLLQALKGPVKCLRLPSLSPTMEKGMVVKWHINHGKMTKEYDLFATMNVLALTDDVFAPDAAVTKNPARDTSANNLTTMLIEIHEELYVAKLFQTPFGRMSPVDTPLALLCEHPDDVETLALIDEKKLEEACQSPDVSKLASDGACGSIPNAMWQAYLEASPSNGGNCSRCM